MIKDSLVKLRRIQRKRRAKEMKRAALTQRTAKSMAQAFIKFAEEMK